eukprot:GFYU01074108.1.p2 GENE.GFYU01074108.1~~GFYU01074108.1.p2  ORF type:complete len:105 (+),score=23.46 GFYU01074108.1:3-317(+)
MEWEMMFVEFEKAVHSCNDAGTREALRTLCDLFALSKIEGDLGWFMTHTPLPQWAGRDITERVNTICKEIQEQDCLAMLDAFGIPNDINSIPIAVGDEWVKIME